MTKGKARWKKFEKLAHQLQRIWAPQKLAGGIRQWEVQGEGFRFQAHLAPDVLLSFAEGYSEVTNSLVRDVWIWYQVNDHQMVLKYDSRMNALSVLGFNEQETMGLTLSGNDPLARSYSTDAPPSAEMQGFIAQWLPLFRRNCFLSGCPIECSAHEQVEWSLWLQERGRGEHE